MTEPRAPSGAMEGRGVYNKYAKLQAGGVAKALPYFERAAAKLRIEPGERPIVIADYGSSQAKNSLVPMRLAIEVLRGRLGADRAILVYHEDLPANDFNALFAVLDQDPDRYSVDEGNVFSCAVGRNFYGAVLPPRYVDLGWCSYAAILVSRIPMLIPNHIHPNHAEGEVRAAFARQASEDWEAFLSLRATELRQGARLVVVLPAVGEGGETGFETIFNHANDALAQMVQQGAVSAIEYKRMVVGHWARGRRELASPFARDGAFRGLAIEELEIASLPDAAWLEYKQDGDHETLARKHALFYRATFVPTLALGLLESDAERRRAFSDRIEELMRVRMAREPTPINSHVAVIVLARAEAPGSAGAAVEV